jgi:hypothetical protein
MAKKRSNNPLLPDSEQLKNRADSGSEILIYQTRDGATKVDVQLVDESVWLTQDQMAQLFQKAKSTINEHIQNIFEEGELLEELVMRKFGISEFSTKPTNFYNLDVIISVGYRVKSQVGTHFRIWATQRLREYIIKGFALDDERLKKARNNYFDELLARIRDIRSSERVFYRKVCDIFATSIDYNAQTELAKTFFATVQNKFHWAIHAHTAAELILLRANAEHPNMGLTNFPGERVTKNDVTVAKNYLNADELDQLNRIVNQFLEFAELQAMQRKPMYMQDWNTKLHGFLTLNDREILGHAGKVSATDAESHALAEYEKYRSAELKRLDTAEDDLDRAIKLLNPPKK